MPIIFSEADRRFTLGERRKLKAFIEHVLCAGEGRSVGNLSFVFCSDDFLLGINQRFLNHDYYTDIITFDLGEGAKGRIDGEVYISIDRVRENALNMGIDFRVELLRVLFHGVLHLCGHGDKTAAAKAKMRSVEDKYLQLYTDFIL
jgi:rRNA maturation RNase YbeY